MSLLSLPPRVPRWEVSSWNAVASAVLRLGLLTFLLMDSARSVAGEWNLTFASTGLSSLPVLQLELSQSVVISYQTLTPSPTVDCPLDLRVEWEDTIVAGSMGISNVVVPHNTGSGATFSFEIQVFGTQPLLYDGTDATRHLKFLSELPVTARATLFSNDTVGDCSNVSAPLLLVVLVADPASETTWGSLKTTHSGYPSGPNVDQWAYQDGPAEQALLNMPVSCYAINMETIGPLRVLISLYLCFVPF